MPTPISLPATLTFATVPALELTLAKQVLVPASEFIVDLADVSEIDSAGLALILSMIRAANVHHSRLIFRHIPQQLSALAQFSGVGSMLGID